MRARCPVCHVVGAGEKVLICCVLTQTFSSFLPWRRAKDSFCSCQDERMYISGISTDCFEMSVTALQTIFKTITLACFIIICFRTSCLWSSFDSAEPMELRKYQSYLYRVQKYKLYLCSAHRPPYSCIHKHRQFGLIFFSIFMSDRSLQYCIQEVPITLISGRLLYELQTKTGIQH
jgi:hypothetical protein